jgi:Pin2-interacting protein X1
MEKMGWKEGKGLGSKEHGMVDHIKVKVKNDTNGKI